MVIDFGSHHGIFDGNDLVWAGIAGITSPPSFDNTEPYHPLSEPMEQHDASCQHCVSSCSLPLHLLGIALHQSETRMEEEIDSGSLILRGLPNSTSAGAIPVEQ